MIIEANNEREIEVLKQAKWQMLRSDIYIRDKGICWVCNGKVELKDYDLGHLVDKCNGGKDDYDNLAVMHRKCNITKPKHLTLEEAMKWKLNPNYLVKPKPQLRLNFPPNMIDSKIPTPTAKEYARGNINPYRISIPCNNPIGHKEVRRYNVDDMIAMKQLTIEYFASRPELLDGRINHARSAAIKQLSSTFGIHPGYIRGWIVESKLVPKRPYQVTDGSQYYYILEHLDEIADKYRKCKHMFLYEQPKYMGMSAYCMEIMFYLTGHPEKVSHKNYPSITKRVGQLGLPIKSLPL